MPLPQGITHLPYNDIEAVTAAISSRTCAVIVEPIIGEGGGDPGRPGVPAGAAYPLRSPSCHPDIR
jgi:acetylornithine/succinyldiaminopimelate/putrescine aminotransferase